MLALLDLLPVVVFFGVYRFYGIYEATIALIAAMVLIIALHWLIKGTVSRMLLVSGAFAVVLGGITVWLENPLFLQWKPTVVYIIFAVVLAGFEIFTPRNVFQRTLADSIEASKSAWRLLNIVWILLFVAMGIANLYVDYNFNMDTWVDFKLYLAIASVVLGFVVTAGFIMMFATEVHENDAEVVSDNATNSEQS